MPDMVNKQLLKDVPPINNRYPGSILATLYLTHPELQEVINDPIINVIAAKIMIPLISF